MAEEERRHATSLGALLVAAGAVAVCCVGPILLVALTTGAGTWLIQAPTRVVGWAGMGGAVMLISIGLVRWQRRACTRSTTTSVTRDHSGDVE
jgi:arginine exporter protein ArgO